MCRPRSARTSGTPSGEQAAHEVLGVGLSRHGGVAVTSTRYCRDAAGVDAMMAAPPIVNRVASTGGRARKQERRVVIELSPAMSRGGFRGRRVSRMVSPTTTTRLAAETVTREFSPPVSLREEFAEACVVGVGVSVRRR